VFQFPIHTERAGRLWGPIDYLFNTPSHHRVHHGSNNPYLDKNYAGVLIVWDRLFGSYAEEIEPDAMTDAADARNGSPLASTAR
jgi:sterol desaturase/sphingolipid hydroxylase (fatty acid hydroxylase superfamily)